MKKGIVATFSLMIVVLVSRGILLAQNRYPVNKPKPQLSGFFDFKDATKEFPLGFGNVSKLSCIVGIATQPAIYSGNMLLDCDAETPHNETTIAVDPNNPDHAIGGYHSYQLVTTGSTLHEHIFGAASVTFNGGADWQEVVPPPQPYEFTGDPALAFDSNGRIYFANIADHERTGARNFTGPSVVVSFSDNGGLSWAPQQTVAAGQGGIDSKDIGIEVFQDKDYLAVDTSSTSAHRNRVYVTWTSFQSKFSSGKSPFFLRFPIMVSFSNDGVHWSGGREISGFSPACVATISGRPNECDLNQDSYPAVAPGGKAYVSFENFNTLAENQVMVVSSNDGGATWSSPSRVDTLFDINYPSNVDGRSTLTGCQLRYGVKANTAADPSDPTGNTVYVVWADNRNGDATSTNTDVFLGRSTDGGQSWRIYTVDNAANDQFYPWVTVAPDGRVDVGYMDRSYSPGQTECKYGFTLTRLTFDNAGNVASTTRQRVDSGLSDPGHSRWFSGSTNGNSRFIGDYNGVAVGPDGATWSLWTDQRNVVANPPSPTRNHGQHAVGTLTAP